MARITSPNSPVPNHIVIQVDGIGDVEVGPEWNDLTPEQQAQAVEEIAADYGSRQPAPSQPAGPQAQQIDIRPGLTREGQGPAGFGDVLLSGGSFGDALAAIPQRAEYQFNELAPRVAGLAQGTASVLDNGADLLEGAYNNTLGRVFGQSNSADPQLNISDLITSGAPQGAFERLAGNLGQGDPNANTVGRVLASALLTRGMGSPAVQGAGAGALMSEAEDGLGVARDAAIGGVGGVIGDRLVRGAQTLLRPVADAGVRALHQAGVRMTPGQHLPALREFEDKAMSWPFIGPSLQRARNEGFEDFARSVPRQALDTLRQRLPGRNIPDVPDGNAQAAVRHTGDQISDVYNDVIPRMRLRSDPELGTDFDDIAASLDEGAISAEGRQRMETLLRRGVMGRFRSRGEMTGEQYKAADSYLEQQIARFGRSENPDDQLISGALQDVRASMRNALVRQNGALGEQLTAADEAWSMLAPAEIAAGQARGGFFSPAAYRRALARGDNRVRRRGMARGEVRGQEFAEAGMDVLPQDHPNHSGTSSHEAYSLGNLMFWQGLGARALYGPSTRNAINAATIGRPQILDPVTNSIADLLRLLPAPQAGAVGTGAIATRFVSPVP